LEVLWQWRITRVSDGVGSRPGLPALDRLPTPSRTVPRLAPSESSNERQPSNQPSSPTSMPLLDAIHSLNATVDRSSPPPPLEGGAPAGPSDQGFHQPRLLPIFLRQAPRPPRPLLRGPRPSGSPGPLGHVSQRQDLGSSGSSPPTRSPMIRTSGGSPNSSQQTASKAAAPQDNLIFDSVPPGPRARPACREFPV